MSGMSIRHIAWTRLLATASVGLVLPAVASAQSINHAELEELFGEPVTTSVTGKPQRASEAPAALAIITRDDIRRSPANDIQIGRAHIRTLVTNAHLVCRLLLEKTKRTKHTKSKNHQ